jgi:hypothetical protein
MYGPTHPLHAFHWLAEQAFIVNFSGEGNFFLCEGRRMNVMQLLQTLRLICGQC